MRNPLFLLLLTFAVLGALGCTENSGQDQIQGKSGDAGLGQQGTQEAAENAGTENGSGEGSDAEPFSARAGLERAKSLALKYAPDAVLISIYGLAGSDGKAMQWEYVFNSLSRKKSYKILIPQGIAREQPYSFIESLPEMFADSTEIPCRSAGEYSVEVEEGSVVWVVASGGDVCRSGGD
ncbi:MAG: hypothetical protein QXU54_00150 [Candidatus Micrarchaeia archaeon]